jgi:hypothetical protein
MATQTEKKPSFGTLDVYSRSSAQESDRRKGMALERKAVLEALTNGEEWAEVEMYKYGVTKIHSIGWEADPKKYAAYKRIFDMKCHEEKIRINPKGGTTGTNYGQAG